MNETTNPTRPRSHPNERFAAPQHLLDLTQSIEKLRAEAREGQHGHRQMTLFHRAPVTLVLFAFEKDGELADHAANGLVTIQVLDGALAVQAEEQNHELRSGNALVLDPNVRHSVRALEPSAMLLTVHLSAAAA